MDVCATMKFYEHHRGCRRVEHMRSPLGPLKPSFHCTQGFYAEPLLAESIDVFVMFCLCEICAQYRYNMRKGGSGSFIFIKYHAFNIYISFVKVPITEHIFFNKIILSHDGVKVKLNT